MALPRWFVFCVTAFCFFFTVDVYCCFVKGFAVLCYWVMFHQLRLILAMSTASLSFVTGTAFDLCICPMPIRYVPVYFCVALCATLVLAPPLSPDGYLCVVLL
jgi:hypothetical protein